MNTMGSTQNTLTSATGNMPHLFQNLFMLTNVFTTDTMPVSHSQIPTERDM